ncbi:type II secretion system protein XpsH [Vulcaniibacterium tengchongense]|uniref:Type II secretion system protein H n=1 Tax=Vulcaniibacterium tengchongense TaxID=1273429 RepID=A0A3N4VJQ7_9GAMM|nr:GspH/FimT family pseudopilin [Vulcaniibacterium tengchongense]RPE79561.1 type II secretion system protein H (GspH) [Vulcaniibacterium tengchongense]
MRTRSRGTSLLEMLLVIVLIAAIGVLAAAALGGGVRGLQLRSAAKEIAAQLRYTRTQAIATGRPQRFTLDPAAHAWSAPNGRRGEIDEAVRVSFVGAREAQPRRGEGAIVFFADGASTGGRVRLSVERAAWDIDVAWLTGEVRLRRGEAEPRRETAQ